MTHLSSSYSLSPRACKRQSGMLTARHNSNDDGDGDSFVAMLSAMERTTTMMIMMLSARGVPCSMVVPRAGQHGNRCIAVLLIFELSKVKNYTKYPISIQVVSTFFFCKNIQKLSMSTSTWYISMKHPMVPKFQSNVLIGYGQSVEVFMLCRVNFYEKKPSYKIL